MATYSERKGKKGSRWTAIIRIKREGEIVHRESKTFPRKGLAVTWAVSREREISESGVPRQNRKVTLAEAIGDYLKERDETDPVGRTKRADMLRLAKSSLGGVSLGDITAKRIIAHARARRGAGAGPSTTMSDLVWIGVITRYARSAWGLSVDTHAVADALELLKRERVVAKSKRRDRRPTREELIAIDERFRYLQQAYQGIRGALRLIMWTAIYSARRLEEITSLRMADYDQARGTWVVRDIKNPKGSTGNHRVMLVTPDLARVVADRQRQAPGDQLFALNPKSVGATWHRQLKILGIEDLHFHDLRHEACSRLAEDGWTIPQIQRVSLHDSWSSLQVYVNPGSADLTRVNYTP